MSDVFSSFIKLVPLPGELTVDWDGIMQSGLRPYLRKMSETAQNPEWHGEGDVLTHTKMVCESLIKMRRWQTLERRKQEELFIAALLHDIGKPACTRLENGRLVSPHHTSVGDRMVRTMLWKDYGLCGTYEAQQFRETVCALIRHHAKPLHFYEEASPKRKAVKLAAQGGLVADFSNELLSLLAHADTTGRIADDTSERLERLAFFKEISKEAGCLTEPAAFPSSFSRYAYLSGRNIFPGQELYDDTWGTVIMLAGLPGTGKDTYMKANYPDLPMVSLDVLRQEMKVSPKEPQGEVVNAARERAKEFLRKKQPFVWNATNLTPALREKQSKMFMEYKAFVKIVFLETQRDEMLKRNQKRVDFVPEPAIYDMLRKLVLPDLSEAREVEWILL